MNSKLQPTGLAWWAGLFLVVSVSVQDARAGAITIEPLGDSITYGFSSPTSVPGGYRSVLYRDLTAAGFQPQFVGTENLNPDLTLPAAASWQEGHVGYQIDGTGGVASFSVNTYIKQWLDPKNGIYPDLILLQLGTNEIEGNYHVPGAPYELAALITEITHLRPNARILVSTLSPVANAALEGEIQTFNKALSGPDGVVAQLQKLGENVVLVNAGGSLTTADLSVDGLHPSQEGYTKLGNAWFDAVVLNNIHPAPEPSTFLIFGIGAVGLVAIGRARRAR